MYTKASAIKIKIKTAMAIDVTQSSSLMSPYERPGLNWKCNQINHKFSQIIPTGPAVSIWISTLSDSAAYVKNFMIVWKTRELQFSYPQASFEAFFSKKLQNLQPYWHLKNSAWKINFRSPELFMFTFVSKSDQRTIYNVIYQIFRFKSSECFVLSQSSSHLSFDWVSTENYCASSFCFVFINFHW